jgi:hypothetical protein
MSDFENLILPHIKYLPGRITKKAKTGEKLRESMYGLQSKMINYTM